MPLHADEIAVARALERLDEAVVGACGDDETVAEAVPASKIVKMAVDTYGKLDGVVNNAGILRDAIFHRMSIDAFESVIKVHLMGSFYVAHAAARIFKEQESGSFVHFTSTSGLIGNFGQANYGAAKAGLINLNDDQGWTFEEIADIVEAQL